MKKQLEANDIADIRLCKNVILCEVQSGGPQSMGCLLKDCTNYIETRRRLGRLRSVLWIHPRSRTAYEEFHDAICFDTTYLVNRHKLSFASIVGVNHHRHSTLFGCALVTNEDTDSFR
ncbi:hypothetical protein ACS0TY_036043 [Phlomoides rotata]